MKQNYRNTIAKPLTKQKSTNASQTTIKETIETNEHNNNAQTTKTKRQLRRNKQTHTQNQKHHN